MNSMTSVELYEFCISLYDFSINSEEKKNEAEMLAQLKTGKRT